MRAITMPPRACSTSRSQPFQCQVHALAGYWQGEICYRRGDMPGAAERFAAYVRLSPKSEPENLAARYNLGYAYFNMKNWEEARKWFDEFLLDYRRKDSYAADAYTAAAISNTAGVPFGAPSSSTTRRPR